MRPYAPRHLDGIALRELMAHDQIRPADLCSRHRCTGEEASRALRRLLDNGKAMRIRHGLYRVDPESFGIYEL